MQPSIVLPDSPVLTASDRILICSASNLTRAQLRLILAGRNVEIYQTANLKRALRKMRRDRPSVMICDRDWRGMLDVANETPVIVTGSSLDEPVWAEVLNRGGYDVLVQPFDASEVLRVVDAALRYGSREKSMAAGA